MEYIGFIKKLLQANAIKIDDEVFLSPAISQRETLTLLASGELDEDQAAALIDAQADELVFIALDNDGEPTLELTVFDVCDAMAHANNKPGMYSVPFNDAAGAGEVNVTCYHVTVLTDETDPVGDLDDFDRAALEMARQTEALRREYNQNEHPDWPRADWQDEVAADNTRLGYWEWTAHRLSEEADA